MLPYLLIPFLALMTNTTSANSECSINNECVLFGDIEIHSTPPTTTAILDLGENCVPLALSEEQLEEFKEIKVKVKVVGKALKNYNMPPEVITFKIESRNLSTMCSSDYILWVSSIEKDSSNKRSLKGTK